MGRLTVMILVFVGMFYVPAASAKNVILFLGDGMGISTVTAARIFAGQQQGLSGEEYDLAFDTFNHVALIKTYNTDAQVPDSAGTITAIVSGQKTRMGVLNVTADVARNDCAASLTNQVPSILELAEEAGLSSGIISTARITHATPAGAYAHVPNRDWENSSTMTDDQRALGCTDIASQLVEFPHGDGVDVILGGGRAQFLPNDLADVENITKTGERDDGNNLINAWLGQSNSRHYAWNSDGFNQFEAKEGHQYMGLFERSHMQFEADRASDPGGEPSLEDMTRFAIQTIAGQRERLLPPGRRRSYRSRASLWQRLPGTDGHGCHV